MVMKCTFAASKSVNFEQDYNLGKSKASFIMNPTLPRREFIKTTGMGLAAVATTAAFSARSYGQVAGANRTLQIAILGTYRRWGAILPSFQNIPNIRITWLCDCNQNLLDRAVQQAQEKLGYTRIQARTCVRSWLLTMWMRFSSCYQITGMLQPP
jgi:hypothetical protein